MRVLLDSHVLIWSLRSPEDLSREALDVLIQHAPVASAASFIELAIKQAQGKIILDDDFPELVAARGIEVLPVNAEHGWMLATLPMLHRDPFDRLIVAQAIVEGLTLVTRDAMIARYGVEVIRA